MSLTSLWFPSPLPSLHLIELGTLMQMCPICEHAQEFVFLQQDFCQTSPKKTEKVICMCFKLLFWILCCKMERDQQWLVIPPLTMCFCLVDFHMVLPGFCWLLERGVAKAFHSAGKSCKTVPMLVCHPVPGCFVPTCDRWEKEVIATVCLDLPVSGYQTHHVFMFSDNL